MAAKKKTTLPVTQSKETTAAKPLTMLVPRLDESQKASDMPEGFEGYEIEIADQQNPIVKFERPGETIMGKWAGAKSINFQGREAHLYYLEADKSFAGIDDYMVSIWGSTVLDNQVAFLDPQIGETIAIWYRGLSESNTKGNPAKLFGLARLTKK